MVGTGDKDQLCISYFITQGDLDINSHHRKQMPLLELGEQKGRGGLGGI